MKLRRAGAMTGRTPRAASFRNLRFLGGQYILVRSARSVTKSDVIVSSGVAPSKALKTILSDSCGYHIKVSR